MTAQWRDLPRRAISLGLGMTFRPLDQAQYSTLLIENPGPFDIIALLPWMFVPAGDTQIPGTRSAGSAAAIWVSEMARLDPWRIREVALLLEDLIATLRSGKNPEWASVFGHFGQELRQVGPKASWDRTEFARLIRNIRLCLAGESGLSRLVLVGGDSKESGALNRRFILLKARIRKALDDIERGLIQFVN